MNPQLVFELGYRSTEFILSPRCWHDGCYKLGVGYGWVDHDAIDFNQVVTNLDLLIVRKRTATNKMITAALNTRHELSIF